jgi:hypothetical protein
MHVTNFVLAKVKQSKNSCISSGPSLLGLFNNKIGAREFNSRYIWRLRGDGTQISALSKFSFTIAKISKKHVQSDQISTIKVTKAIDLTKAIDFLGTRVVEVFNQQIAYHSPCLGVKRGNIGNNFKYKSSQI